jgi:diguanylate cyclase (GGDEF)-like protein
MIQDNTQLGAHEARKTGNIMLHAIPGGRDRDLERDGWWRVMSAGISFMKWAQTRLDEAEAKIAAQQERIAALEQIVMRDEVTGLLNRRGFMEALGREMERVKRKLSVGGLLILVDLDNFRMINDLYSRTAGDAALRMIGRTLSDNIRAMDACGRVGGDEFILLLADTERDKALVRAQNLIRNLNNLSLVWYGAELPLRASLEMKEYRQNTNLNHVFPEDNNSPPPRAVFAGRET